MRRLRLNPLSWPLRVKVPLSAALFTIAVAVGISNIVLDRLAATQNEHLRQLAGAYLDGLSTALQPYVLRRDTWEAFDVLDRARGRYSGLPLRHTLVVLPDGSVLAASDPTRFPIATSAPDDFARRLSDATPLVIDEDRATASLLRRLRDSSADLGFIVAEIDITRLMAERHETLLTLIAVNGLFALLLAALSYLLVRRMLAPVGLLAEHLSRAIDGPVYPIEERRLPRANSEFGRLLRRFNQMVAAMQEREQLARRLAQEERAALLGKLASGMAHEVNNPLGGMFNALALIRQHGSSDKIRESAIQLLERGLSGIRNIVRSSLVTYKGGKESTTLSSSDIDDIRFLIQNEIERRQLRLKWLNEVGGTLSVNGEATRQIALNLLLNAATASLAGGVVQFVAKVEKGRLVLVVGDDGPGMPAAYVDMLTTELDTMPPATGSLGIWTVNRLVQELRGSASVSTGAGTEITVALPLKRDQLDSAA
jgi:signal transduction histidine kinase